MRLLTHSSLSMLLKCLLFPHLLLLPTSPLFPVSSFLLYTILSFRLSFIPPRAALSTEHCIVPCYLFLRANSLSVACDIRGLTEHQPVVREDTASLSGREARCLWGEDRQRGSTWLGWFTCRTQLKDMEWKLEMKREWVEAGLMKIYEAKGRQKRNVAGWECGLTAAVDSHDLKPLIIRLKMGLG